MDIDAEMERLTREARAKLDAERGGQEAAPEPSTAERPADIDAATLDEAQRLAARPGAKMSMGGKVVTVLAALVVAWVLWSYVLAPLLALAILVAIVGAIVWVVIKLMDDDDGDDGDEKKSPS
jgi:Flp pilus assembly protein TadB